MRLCVFRAQSHLGLRTFCFSRKMRGERKDEREGEGMKKVVALILALSMVFALCACGEQTTSNSDNQVANTEVQTVVWEEPLSDEQKTKIIEKCIKDYNFEKDKSFISTDLSDWEFAVYPEYENMIVARCTQQGKRNPQRIMAVCAFVPTRAGTLSAKYELINWGDCVVWSEEKDRFEGYLIELGYLDEYGNPIN